jgi:rubrerythrin
MNARNRREILVASAALAGGAGAGLIASCGGGDSKTPSTATVSTTQMRDDAALVGALLDMELSSVVAYGYVEPHLSGPALGLARRFAAHERAHAGALQRALAELGAPPLAVKPDAEYEASFPALRGQADALEFALDVENTAVGAYAEALGKIYTDTLRAQLASIMAAEAEQAAAWLGRLGMPQVPDAFVTGPPPEVEDE